MILVNKLWNNYWSTKAKGDDEVPTHGQWSPWFGMETGALGTG